MKVQRAVMLIKIVLVSLHLKFAIPLPGIMIIDLEKNYAHIAKISPIIIAQLSAIRLQHLV